MWVLHLGIPLKEENQIYEPRVSFYSAGKNCLQNILSSSFHLFIHLFLLSSLRPSLPHPLFPPSHPLCHPSFTPSPPHSFLCNSVSLSDQHSYSNSKSVLCALHGSDAILMSFPPSPPWVNNSLDSAFNASNSWTFLQIYVKCSSPLPLQVSLANGTFQSRGK